MTTATIGDNTADTFSGTIDFELDAFEPTNNGAHNGTAFQVKAPGAFPDYGLVAFTGLSNITGPVTVSSATLRLYLQSEFSSTQITVTVRRVLRNWVENQVTYNIYSTGNSWTTAGCLSDGNDRVGSASATISNIGNGTGVYYDFSSAGMATDVQNWINTPGAVYGWHLSGDVADEFKNFVSRTGSDGQRPKLVVVYTVAGAGGGPLTGGLTYSSLTEGRLIS